MAASTWKPWAVKAGEQAKAIVVTLANATVGTVICALSDGHITSDEWWAIAGAAAAAYGITFYVPNAKSADKSTSTPDL